MSLSTRDDNLETFVFLVDHAPDAIIFANPQGTFQIWNNAATGLFGYSHDEVVGQNLDMIIPEHQRRSHWVGFREAMASGHSKHGRRALKMRAMHKYGQKLYATFAFSVVKDRHGKVIGAMATARECDEKG